MLSVQIENLKFLPVCLRIRVAEVTDTPVDFTEEEKEFARATSLLWHQGVMFNWKMAAQRRGVNSLGPLHLQVSDFLGFFPGLRYESPGRTVSNS